MSSESMNQDMMFCNKDLKRVGRSISVLLTLAVKEYRVTCGLIPTIRMLEEHSEQVLFCIMLNTTDSDTHMQSTLVQAFCYERNISIIKVDRIDILEQIIGSKDCNFILIHKNMGPHVRCLDLELERILHTVEDKFITQPVFRLPAK